jgi:hypothetical protein
MKLTQISKKVIYVLDFPKTRFYSKEQINNALDIKDDISGENIDVFNLGLILDDFDGCANKRDIKIRFNQLCPSRAREIKGS